jgi:ABC-2 type transport system ATP-binding protein
VRRRHQDPRSNHGPRRALSLSVSQGEVHGFLGPNGAGKTTTLRILLRRDAGDVAGMGRDPWTDAVELHGRLAYVPGDVELWPNLTGGEAIDLLGRLRGHLDPTRRDELIDRFDLDPIKKGRTYSKDNRQKVAIVAALASDAELLLLDEPTTGLDPLMEVEFQDVIGRVTEEGRTVLLSSHILAQVEKLADRISIIREWLVVQSGTLAEMRHLTRTTIEALTVEPVFGLETLTGIHEDQQPDPKVFVLTLLAYFVATVVTSLLAAGVGVESTGDGAALGVVVGVGYALTAAAVTAIYDQKPQPLTYFWINGVFNVAGLTVVGAILGAFA